MPKLQKTIDDLKGEKRQKRERIDGVTDQVVQSADGLSRAMTSSLQAMHNASNQSRQQMANILLQEMGKIVPALVKTHDSLIRRVEALEKRLAESEQLSRDNVKALLGGTEAAVLENMGVSGDKLDKLTSAMAEIEESIGKIEFPATDIKPLQDRLDSVALQVAGIKIPKQKDRRIPKEAVVVRERDDFGEDRITKVVFN